MKNLILFVTVVSISLVIGLPVQENVRSIHRNKAEETLLQDVQGLKEQLQAVEEELQDFQARQTAFKPLEDFDNTENVASDQEIAKLNRHFQSVKQQIYNRPAHVLEEETDSGKKLAKCDLEMVNKMKKPFEKTAELIELALEIQQDPFPDYYIESKDNEHRWHCFEYVLNENSVSNNFYGAVHKEDNDEFEHEESYGKDMCACSELVNKLHPTTPAPKVEDDGMVLAEELKQAMTHNDGRVMGSHGMNHPAYMNEEETPKCDLSEVEIKIFNEQTESERKNLTDLSKEITNELPERFIASPDDNWHCFIYSASYAVIHQEFDGRFEEEVANEGTSDCTCLDLVEKIQDQIDEKKEEKKDDVKPEDEPKAMSMWDEWSDDSRLAKVLEEKNLAVSLAEEDPSEMPQEEDKKKCDPSQYTVGSVETDGKSLETFLQKVPEEISKNLHRNDEYIASEDNEWHCFKYGMAPSNTYVIVHGSQVEANMGIDFCTCYDMFLQLNKPKDTLEAKSMWDEWNDDYNRGHVPADVQNQWENRNEMEYNRNPVQNQWENRNEMEYNRNPVQNQWENRNEMEYNRNPVQNQWENRNEMEYNRNPVQNQWENRNEMDYNRRMPQQQDSYYSRGSPARIPTNRQ